MGNEMAYHKTDRIQMRVYICKRMCVYMIWSGGLNHLRISSPLFQRRGEMWRDAQPLYFTYCNRKFERAVARRRSMVWVKSGRRWGVLVSSRFSIIQRAALMLRCSTRYEKTMTRRVCAAKSDKWTHMCTCALPEERHLKGFKLFCAKSAESWE